MAKTSLALGFTALCIVLMLGGCARPVGDFGRAEPDVIHDELMPAIGKARASRAEPLSDFNLADEEQEMRDRIWRFLVDPHAYDWFGSTTAELERTRIKPVELKAVSPSRYYDWLHGTRFASARVRNGKLDEDVTLDVESMPGAFAAICAVLAIDHQRGVAANGLPNLDDGVRANAAARQWENQTVISWFVFAARNRYDSYGYALDHLVVETPNANAVTVNASLSQLSDYVAAAERGDFCAIAASGPHDHQMAVRSRYLIDGTVKGS